MAAPMTTRAGAVSSWNTLVCVVARASFHWRFGHGHRSFINPEVTTRAAATKGALNNRQHFRVRRVAPWADVGAWDADFRPSFHGFGKCKALATEKAHHFIVSPRDFCTILSSVNSWLVRFAAVEPSSGYCSMSEMRRDDCVQGTGRE